MSYLDIFLAVAVPLGFRNRSMEEIAFHFVEASYPFTAFRIRNRGFATKQKTFYPADQRTFFWF
jgi:hypothetical protein